MKFSLLQLMLVVTLTAVLLWLFSGSHNQTTIGRHVLYALMVLLAATGFGYWPRDWHQVRLRCGIAGLIGAVLYCIFVWLFRETLIALPPLQQNALFPSLSYDAVFWRDCYWQIPLSFALGSTVAPLIILLRSRMELSEIAQTNCNISTVLLGLVLLSWLLAAIDGWNRSYLRSHWMPILVALLFLFVLFTFSWIGDVFKSVDRRQPIQARSASE